MVQWLRLLSVQGAQVQSLVWEQRFMPAKEQRKHRTFFPSCAWLSRPHHHSVAPLPSGEPGGAGFSKQDTQLDLPRVVILVKDLGARRESLFLGHSCYIFFFFFNGTLFWGNEGQAMQLAGS